MDPKESQNAWDKVVAKAWSDELFKKRLLADPATLLKEHGIEVPAEVNVKVMEDSAKTVHLILPERHGELSDVELDQVAGGLCSVGDDAQLANVDLQKILQKQQQTLQTLSNISKTSYDTAMSLIHKIGG